MPSNPQIENITRCPRCRKKIFDGRFLRSRINDLQEGVLYAQCSKCKTWVKVPQVRLIPQ